MLPNPAKSLGLCNNDGVPPKQKPRRPIFNRVRVLRTERDFSRAALAELVDVNPQTIGALERGDHYPSLDLAMRICEVFELPVEAVFSRTEFTPLSPDQLAPR